MAADDPNNLIVVGALWAALGTQVGKGAVTRVDLPSTDNDLAANQFQVTLSFMASPYRITVERVED